MTERSTKVNFFWHGSKLGDVHRACIRSFQRHGHVTVLHCYDPPQDVPHNVEMFDATKIMPRADLIANRETGSVAIGVNRYRYRILQAGMGTYADCDMFLLRPLPDDAYLIGRQNSWDAVHPCNNALLRYPSDSTLADRLVKATLDETATLPWQSKRRRVYNMLRKAVGRPPSVVDMPWGVWGPKLLSHWVGELNLNHHTKPIDVFYPLHYFSLDLLFDPDLRLSDLVTPRTVAVHLCHRMLDKRPIPAGSPMDEILKTGLA